MRFHAFFTTAVLSLALASPALGLSVSSRWVIPSRIDTRFEMMPQERTKPILVGDILYFANLAGEVYAVHRTEGYVFWKVKMPAAVNGALTYGRSRIYVGDIQGNLKALHARDGSEAWSFKSSAEWLSPPTFAKNLVFATNSADEVFALTESQGKEVWRYSQRGDERMSVWGGAGPVVFGDALYQGFSDGTIVALSAAEGKRLWAPKKLRTRFRFYDIDMNPYVDETGVIAATFDGKLYKLDRLSGDTKWVFPAGSYGGFLVENDTLYFSSLNGTVYALNKDTGSVIWKTTIDAGVGLAPAKVGDYIVVSTSQDPVFVLDAKSGKVLWKKYLGAGTLAGVAGHSDGWFYCLSNYANLYSFTLEPDMKRIVGKEVISTPSALHRVQSSTDNNAS